MQLSAIDWTIIVAYFAVTLGIGLVFSRRAGRNLSEYFVSGRNLPWWIAGTSMVATSFAADTPLAVTELVAKYGLAGNWFWWAFALGGMVTVFVYARLWRRAEVLTDVELVELRYSGRPAAFLRGFRALYVALLINPIIIGWVTVAMLKVLKNTVLVSVNDVWLSTKVFDQTVNIPYDAAIIIGCLAIVGVYSTLAGLWGVVLTDAIQFVLAMVGCIVLAVIAVNHVGGIDQLQAKVASNFSGGEQAFRFLPDFSASDPWMPINIFLIMLAVQWWATWYPGAEPGGGGYIVQRMASCKDERHSLFATLWYQIAHYCVRPWPWLMISFAALAMYPELSGMIEQGDDPGVAFPMVMRDLSPVGLRGLMLVTFFAAFMSTISTQMNWGASYLASDFYRRFVLPDASDRHLTRTSRIVSVGVLILGAVAAWLMRETSIDEAWKMLAALGAGTGAVFMLRWFWWRINAWSEITAMIASFVLYVGINEFAGRYGYVIASEHVMAVVAALTIATWLFATFMTKPESSDTLLQFYRKVQPGGPGWKPVAATAPDIEVDRHLGLSLLAALFAAGIVYLTLPGIGLVIFGQYVDAALCLGGAAVCGGVVYALARRIGWKKIV